MIETSPQQSQIGDSTVVDYLLLAGKQYKEHIALLRRQKELGELRGVTFKPVVTPYAMSLVHSAGRAGVPIEERLHTLNQQKQAEQKAMVEAQKREVEARVAALPFKPKLTKHAEALKRPEGVVTATRAWDVARTARQERARVAAQRLELSEVTGAPCISAYAQERAREGAGRPRGMPVEDFLLAREGERRRRLYERVEQSLHSGSCRDMGSSRIGRAEVDGTCGSCSDRSDTSRDERDGLYRVSTTPFVPAISKRAAQLSREGSVVDRLYAGPSQGEAKTDVFDEDYITNCTFKPAISEASRELFANYYRNPELLAKPAYERLYENPQFESRFRTSAAALAEQERSRAGRPQISANSRAIMRDRRQRSVEAGEDVSPNSRLHGAKRGGAGTTSKRKPVVTPAEAEQADGFSHRPHISKGSETLWRQQVEGLLKDGRARSSAEARDLLWRMAQKRKEEEMQKQRALKQTEELLECTFKPVSDGDKRQKRTASRVRYNGELTVEERAKLWERQRQERLERLRQEHEALEEAECTFKPVVHAEYPLPRTAANSAGEDAFLKRQETARRQRVQEQTWWLPKEEREAVLAEIDRHASTRNTSSKAGGVNLPVSQSPHGDRHQRHYDAVGKLQGHFRESGGDDWIHASRSSGVRHYSTHAQDWDSPSAIYASSSTVHTERTAPSAYDDDWRGVMARPLATAATVGTEGRTSDHNWREPMGSSGAGTRRLSSDDDDASGWFVARQNPVLESVGPAQSEVRARLRTHASAIPLRSMSAISSSASARGSSHDGSMHEFVVHQAR